jgi:hypothetical protein
MDPGATGFGLAFLSFAVAAGAAVPRVGAVHHPAFRQWDKAGDPHRPLLHCDPPPGPRFCEPSLQGMLVLLALATDDGEPREICGADVGE